MASDDAPGCAVPPWRDKALTSSPIQERLLRPDEDRQASRAVSAG